jgi:serine/threonine-protein kinase
LAIPDRIGRYRIEGLLGQGAMGVVYRGVDPALERPVAIKVMSQGLADERARRRFESEARAAARLQHPNIITIFELGVHEGRPFMALELLEGVDLQRAIEAGLRPDPRATLPIVLQLLAGLGHAHQRGIVHRDVKPSNVFLCRRGPAKIMDFGVAHLGEGLTTAGRVLGTPNYMSPEQVQGTGVDGRSDLFSAALILFELVTGEKAYRADTVVGLLYKITHEAPDLRLLPQEPAWDPLRATLQRALQRDPAQRHPDAASMTADLERAHVALGGSAGWAQIACAPPLRKPGADAATAIEPATPLAPLPSAPPPAMGRHTGLIAAGLVGAAAVVLAGALWLTRQQSREAPQSFDDAAAARMPTPAQPASTSLRPGPPATQAPTPVATTPLPTASVPLSLASEPPRQAPAAPAPTTPRSAPPPAEAAVGPVAPEDARLERAEDLFESGRYAQAMAEAKAVLARDPGNDRAKGLVEDAEVELLVLAKLREARAALERGDREAALAAVKTALAAQPSDGRLIALWRQLTSE